MKPAKAFLISVLLSFVAAAQTIDPEAIDAAVQEAMKSWQVPGAAIAIVEGDRVVHMKGYPGERLRGGGDSE